MQDSTGSPISSASVIVQGTNLGTSTDVAGRFSLQFVGAEKMIEVSAVGYLQKEVSLDGQSELLIILEPEQGRLEEVVLIGYQKVTRKKATASISSISGREIENLPMSSFDQLMQGRLSGVNVQNFSGDPGARAAVSVRGSSLVSSSWDQNNVISSPLYVVDGVPQSNEEYVTPGAGTGMNYLAGINPNDIESIDVLKDASAAAIYGSRAANGVILITTKKGRSGAPRVTFSGYTGLTERPKLREVTLGTTERRQKLKILQSQLTYAQQQQLPYMLTDSLNPAFNGNTDWQGLFYQNGTINNADLGITGGNDMSSYRFSTGYYDESGIIKATGFKRYSARLNLLSKALKGKLEINPILFYTRTSRSRGLGSDPRYNNTNPFSLGAGNMPSSLFNLSDAKKEAILAAYDENLDRNLANVFNMNLNLAYNFNAHLRFSSLSSYKYSTSRRDFNRTSAMESNLGNYSYTYSDQTEDMLTSNYFSYTNTWGDHNFSGVAGQDIQFNVFENTSASGAYGASDNIKVVQGFLQDNITAYSDYQSYGLLSYYSRLSYDYKDRYLFSFAGRWDGSSRFGEGNKWGFFPSGSAAWILSEEAFFRELLPVFNLFKIRGSYGTSGSLPSQNYLQYNLYNVNAGGYGGNAGATSYNGTTAITPNFYNGAAQPTLSWEKSTQWNVGLDMELEKGRYSGSIDIYNKESSLQLFSVNLPVTTGYTKALTNAIGVRNAGVELTIAANPLPKSSPVQWFSRLNVSYNKNAIMNLPNGNRDLVLDGDRFDKSHILSVGSPINAFYLLRTLGVFATEDDIPVNPFTGEKYRNSNGTYTAGAFYLADLDGDNFIDIFNSGINPDKIPMGDPNPRITGGWTNNITWKNFTLGLFFNFVFKRDILNLYLADQFSNSTAGDATSNFVLYSTPNLDAIDIWRQPGDQATYAKYDLGTYLYYYTSAQSFFLTKGDFVRLKNINLQYRLPEHLTNKWGIGGCKMFLTLDNAARWQASRLLPDAENVNSYGEYAGDGYPIPRKYTFGLQFQF
ncbi:TonB-dependent receptor [Niabella terrae]